MDLVHYKEDYGDIAGAIGKPDGLAILGVLFEISGTDNPAFTPLVNAVRQIKRPG